jgi:hypothetical protein
MPRKANWDQDSPRLQNNLKKVLREIRDKGAERRRPSVEDAREWHRKTMEGLNAEDPKYVAAFRVEEGLEDVWVSVGALQELIPRTLQVSWPILSSGCKPKLRNSTMRLGSAGSQTQRNWPRLFGWAHGRTPNGCEFILLPTATVVRRAYGLTALLCGTGCHLFSNSVHGPVESTTSTPAPKPCSDNGS